MKQVFLAFSFRNEDRDFAAQVVRLIESHVPRVTTGERAGGEAITPKVMARIDRADGLVALLTQREEKTGGGWTTHQWVRDELNHARTNHKRTIALIEEGVDVGGAYAENERIPFDRDDPGPAFLALSETVGMWKQEAGRTIKVQILPREVARLLARDGSLKCRCRFVVDGRYTDWSEVTPIPEEGGTFISVEGVGDDHLIQIAAQDDRSEWISIAVSQWMQVKLTRRKPDQ